MIMTKDNHLIIEGINLIFIKETGKEIHINILKIINTKNMIIINKINFNKKNYTINTINKSKTIIGRNRTNKPYF